MKKSSLKNYITLLEAAADSATHVRDYWMREHERRVEELLEADNEIAELKADAAANASDYWARQHELKRRLDDNGGLLEAKQNIAELKADAAADARDYWMRQHELLEAKDEIVEFKRRLDEAENEIAELREDNERLSKLL